MIKIDQLPVEILMKIFSFLPSYSNVSLVNKLFYDAACAVNDSNVCPSFYSIFMENGNHQSIMDSIQNTQRKISKLSFSFGINTEHLLRKSAISDAIKIIKTFSATIKYFKLECISIEMADFLEILSWLPNVEVLVLHRVVEKKQSKSERQLSNECLKLNQLKTLELYLYSEEILVVFNRLPAGVLKELTIEYWDLNLNLLNDLFTQQFNIKCLVLWEYDESRDSTLPDHILDHLKLESLELYQNEYNSTHATILSKQTQLKSLSLRNSEADGIILNIITNQLRDLETLHFNINETLVVPFKSLKKLKKLKDLTLEHCTLELLETFAGLDNSRITTLYMESLHTYNMETIDEDNPPMPIHVISALAISVPNLKVLRFDYYCEYPIISAIMQHFNFIEVLEMKYDFHIDAKLLCETVEFERCFNPKLTEFKITEKFVCDESLLTKLIAIYPNLKKFEISSSTLITTSQLKVILNGFKKMESLDLFSEKWKWLSMEYLDCIRDHKNNLKSITLHSFDYSNKFTAEHKEKLNGVFDVIKYNFATLYLTDK